MVGSGLIYKYIKFGLAFLILTGLLITLNYVLKQWDTITIVSFVFVILISIYFIWLLEYIRIREIHLKRERLFKEFDSIIELGESTNCKYCDIKLYLDFGELIDKKFVCENCNKVNDLNNDEQTIMNYAKAYYKRGIKYYDSGNYNYALEDFDNAIQINPNYEIELRQYINNAKKGTGINL